MDDVVGLVVPSTGYVGHETGLRRRTWQVTNLLDETED